MRVRFNWIVWRSHDVPLITIVIGEFTIIAGRRDCQILLLLFFIDKKIGDRNFAIAHTRDQIIFTCDVNNPKRRSGYWLIG